MVMPERGLLILLAKLGIKSAHVQFMRRSILRSMKIPNPWYIQNADDEPDVMGAGLLFHEEEE